MEQSPLKTEKAGQESPSDEARHEDHEADFIPRGAFYFVLVLIIGYTIYFFLTWYEIVVLRGGGA